MRAPSMQTPSVEERSLRVVVVDDDALVRQGLVYALERMFGHQVVAQAANGAQMVEMVLQTDPDVVVFDIHLPDVSGLDALSQICEQKEVAAVAITADRDLELVRRASKEHVLGYLLKPFEPEQLGPSLQVARARFEEMRDLNEENNRLQSSLANRKTIERAKGMLMKRHNWTEAEAFRRLQRAAMNGRTTMIDLAQQVLNGVNLEL
jgi:two-component system, response regulator PdtaR